ncbi:MAG: metal-dependent hydrolase [Candidatus Aenigmarchaeota archaeon]|nr:metal-dependent hydrolase [Candidatus Aenigmarchaeota archaeon]
MPSWKTHIFINLIIFLFWLKLLFLLRPETGIFYVVVISLFAVIVSVFPDIDTNKSRVRNWLALILAVMMTILYLINFNLSEWYSVALFFTVSYCVIRFFPTHHRGFTHTLNFSFILSLILFFITYFFLRTDILTSFMTFIILFVCYSSHLILDRIIKIQD